MFLGFPYEALVCWIHSVIMVYVITGEYSLCFKQTFVISRSNLKESKADLVSLIGSTPLTFKKFAAK